ncbi:LCP family protein [Nocardioides taihuensis]|uniref:LCP family protein n=1 Tax=Nocardioides taihuensis TaxID=1835606 RepID=A0ABW0BMC9_9ACTN
MTRTRARALLRISTLAAVLAVVGLVVPDSAVRPADMALVKLQTAEGVDPGGDDVVWILAVGSDARPGETMTRTRGDALQLIGINPRTSAATSIGIPRDSYVSIPGYGSDRINASMVYGGPQLLGETVGNLVGIQPDYVFVTKFPYFIDMVNDIGGITVHNPRAFSDTGLKPGGFKAGDIHLNGYGAMAFSRIRHSLPGGDFDRSANQQRTLAGIQARIRQQADKPGFIEKGVLSVMQHLDTNLAPGELFRLAQLVAQVDPSKITGCVVQGGFAMIGGASVVTPDTGQARRYGDVARTTAVIRHC